MKGNRPFVYFLVLMTVLACSMRLGAQLNCSGGWCPPFTVTGNNAVLAGTFQTTALGVNTAAGAAGTITMAPAVNGIGLQVLDSGFGIYTSQGNALNSNWGDDANDTLLVNFHGYHDGTTRKRSTAIYDGTGGLMWTFDGTTGNLVPTGTSNIGTTGNRVSSGFITTLTGTTVTAGATSTTTITTAAVQMRGNAVLLDGTPTCSGGGCVVLANSINSAGSVSTTTTGAADITITFSANFQHAPVCLGDNATTGNLLRATQEAVNGFHLQGVTAGGDTLGYVCIGN